MKKSLFAIVLLCIMFSSIQCFSQVRDVHDSTYLGLCWTTNLDTSARYILYYKAYQTSDTNWYFIAKTTTKDCYIEKGNLKGKLIFGVKSIWHNDTSEMHMSIDTTACLPTGPGSQCGEGCTNGGWYIDWHIQKPKKISVKQ